MNEAQGQDLGELGERIGAGGGTGIIILWLAGLRLVDFFDAVLGRHYQFCMLGLEDAGLPRVLIDEVLSAEPLSLLAVGESTEPGNVSFD